MLIKKRTWNTCLSSMEEQFPMKSSTQEIPRISSLVIMITSTPMIAVFLFGCLWLSIWAPRYGDQYSDDLLHQCVQDWSTLPAQFVQPLFCCHKPTLVPAQRILKYGIRDACSTAVVIGIIPRVVYWGWYWWWYYINPHITSNVIPTSPPHSIICIAHFHRLR